MIIVNIVILWASQCCHPNSCRMAMIQLLSHVWEMLNYTFSQQSFMGFTSGEELQNAIESCKERIKSLPPSSDDHKQLVKKLVQLRLKLHEQKV